MASKTGETPEMEKIRSQGCARRNQTVEAALAELKDQMGLKLTKAQKDNVPRRPEYSCGKKGKPVQLFVNYFRMRLRGLTIFQYDISFDRVDAGGGDPQPDVEEAGIAHERRFRRIAKSLHRQLLDAFVNGEGKELFRGKRYAYDNEKMLYTNGPLGPLEDGKTHDFPFLFQENHGQAQTGENAPHPRQYVAILTKTTELGLEFQVDPNAPLDPSVTRQILQAVDIISKQHAFSNLVVFGTKVFYPESQDRRISLRGVQPAFGSGKELAFGYHQGSKICEGGLMLNIDRAAGVFYQAGPLFDRVVDFLQISEERAAIYQLQETDLNKLNREFRSLRIETTHLPYKRKYRINGFTATSAIRTYFTRDTGEISVADYFRELYGELRHGNFPCVMYGSDKEPKYLPIEVCWLIANQRNTRKMEEHLLGQMTKATTGQKPWERKRAIEDAARDIASAQSLVQFGVKVDIAMVQVKARLLDAPEIKYNKDFKFQPIEGSWMMARPNKLFLGPRELNSWVILNFSRSSGVNDVLKPFVSELIKVGRGIGFNIRPPNGPPILIRSLKELAEKLDQLKKGPKLQLIVCIIPKNDELYTTIKYRCDIGIGVATQVVLDSNYNPRSQQKQKILDVAFVSNLLLKMHVKIGGINLGLSTDAKPAILKRCTMIVGIDVTHPSPGETSPSIAACVGSLDAEFGLYTSKFMINDSRDEMVQVGQMIGPMLDKFQTRNKRIPASIIVFRDGVSEGQFAHVILFEIYHLLNAIKKIPNPPLLTYIVVQKRHNTRFFPLRKEEALKSGNIFPGIVVDNLICHYKLVDYYLCSHNAMLGTCRPSKYTLLYDENSLDADHVQAMTYHLCYLFARCTKSIADPAPVRYAHHAAARAKLYWKSISKQSNINEQERARLVQQAMQGSEELKNILYFI